MADGLEISPEQPLLLKGDCLELMKTLPAKSVDLFVCDLPYGETNCSWDTKIDLGAFWKEFKRIRKSKRTACIHFCSTAFGYSLIKSWERGFKMDMVWKKRNKTGGLQSRYRPMRNHEMVYFFYEQAPKYNRDKYHKRIANQNVAGEKASVLDVKAKDTSEEEPDLYGEKLSCRQRRRKEKGSGGANEHEPPNPASVLEGKCSASDGVREIKRGTSNMGSSVAQKYSKDEMKAHARANGGFDTPTPASVIETQGKEYWDDQPNDSKTGHGWDKSHMNTPRVPSFDPSLPASVQEAEDTMYGEKKKERHERYLKDGVGAHDPPNPGSVQEDNSVDIFDELEEPHLAPFSTFESGKCFIGKRNHQTEKPQDILEFFLKYWSDEGDVICDPTMGSGSTGVACKKMGRSFIGIELTEKYYDVSQKRISTTCVGQDALSKV